MLWRRLERRLPSGKVQILQESFLSLYIWCYSAEMILDHNVSLSKDTVVKYELTFPLKKPHN